MGNFGDLQNHITIWKHRVLSPKVHKHPSKGSFIMFLKKIFCMAVGILSSVMSLSLCEITYFWSLQILTFQSFILWHFGIYYVSHSLQFLCEILALTYLQQTSFSTNCSSQGGTLLQERTSIHLKEAVSSWFPSVAEPRPHSSRAAFHQWPSVVGILQPGHVCSNMDYSDLALELPVVLAETLKGMWCVLRLSVQSCFQPHLSFKGIIPQEITSTPNSVSVFASYRHIASPRKARPADMFSYFLSIDHREFPSVSITISPLLDVKLILSLDQRKNPLHWSWPHLVSSPHDVLFLFHFYINLSFSTASKHPLATSSYLRITRTHSALGVWDV